LSAGVFAAEGQPAGELLHNFIVQNDMRSRGAPAQNGANSKKKYKKEICRILRQIFLFRREKVA